MWNKGYQPPDKFPHIMEARQEVPQLGNNRNLGAPLMLMLGAGSILQKSQEVSPAVFFCY